MNFDLLHSTLAVTGDRAHCPLALDHSYKVGGDKDGNSLPTVVIVMYELDRGIILAMNGLNTRDARLEFHRLRICSRRIGKLAWNSVKPSADPLRRGSHDALMTP